MSFYDRAQTLFYRLLELDNEDLEVIEQAVSRLEPEGKEAWKEYLSLKNSIRRENNPDRKERLMAEALELGRKYGF